MPNYDYVCSSCNSTRELYRGFNDAEFIPTCCDQDMKRVYTPNGVIFKGSGFYKTGN